MDNQEQGSVDTRRGLVNSAPQGSGSTNRDSQGTRPGLGWLIGAVVLVVLLWAGWWYLSVFHLGSDTESRGQIGDLFGGVNALFTGLAFAALIYTIVLQRKELEVQRQDLALSRNELRNSVEAQRGQVEQLERAASLSAISTLIGSYGRKLDNIAADDVYLEQELTERRGVLGIDQDDLADKKARLEGLEEELYRIQQALADPQITDSDTRARLDTDRENLVATHQEQQQEVEGKEQTVRQLSEFIQRLEARVSGNKNQRDDTNRRHEALVFHLEKLVEDSINQSISEVGNIASEEAVGGLEAGPPSTRPQTSPNGTTE